MASLPACSTGDHEEAEKNHDDSGRSKEVEEENKVDLVYGIEDNPPIMQLIVLGFQVIVPTCICNGSPTPQGTLKSGGGH